jgi:hypothetical protein
MWIKLFVGLVLVLVEPFPYLLESLLLGRYLEQGTAAQHLALQPQQKELVAVEQMLQ